MNKYHLTLSQGRADTIYLEADSKNKILNLFNTLSTAVVRNIKKVVYSKAFNINYTEKPYVRVPVYHKVEIFALSKSYSQTFTVFNVKRSVTKEMLETEYKKLLINDEPIIDFFSIVFFRTPDNVLDYRNLYQVQYKRDSKTHTENYYANDYRTVKEIFENTIGGELLEIRKFEYYSSSIVKDDGNYHKAVNLFVTNDDASMSIKLPKVKKNLSHYDILNLVQTNLTFNGKKIDINKIRATYK